MRKWRRGLRALAALAVLAGMVVLSATDAGAVPLVQSVHAAGDGGYYGYCDVELGHGENGSGWVAAGSVSCNLPTGSGYSGGAYTLLLSGPSGSMYGQCQGSAAVVPQLVNGLYGWSSTEPGNGQVSGYVDTSAYNGNAASCGASTGFSAWPGYIGSSVFTAAGWSCQVRYGSGSFVACLVEGVGGDGTHDYGTFSGAGSSISGPVAPYPADYYTGGSAGTGIIPVTPAPTGVVCARTLHAQSGSTGIADFTGSAAAAPAGVALSYAWAFGDGSGTAATANASYTYTFPEPANGWTAQLTVTATGDGVSYSGTAATKCFVRVDWNYPNDTTPGSTGAAGGSTIDCPSGWGWLDPSAIVTTLECLFVPSSSSLSSWGHVWDNAKTAFPFSVVTPVESYLSTFQTDLENTTAPQGADGSGGQAIFNNICGSGPNHVVTCPTGTPGGPAYAGGSLDNTSTSLGGFASWVKMFLTLALYGGFGYAVVKWVGRALG